MGRVMRVCGWRGAIRISTLIVATAIVGCATTPPAEVEDRSFQSDVPTPSSEAIASTSTNDNDRYRVQRGDTLYSIAFRRGMDYRDLASWNGIEAPYRIFVGQDLRMTSSRSVIASTSQPIASAPTAEGVVTRGASDDSRPAKVTALSSSSVPTISAPASAPPPKSSPPSVIEQPIPKPVTPPPAPIVAIAPPKPPETNAPVETAKPIPAGNSTWRWPNSGAVIGTFVGGDQTRQGIDIAGKAGDPVTASADGDVVYSGNGLLGYGELIIIKHNANFLSAYGHNRKRLVQEGEKVRAGQQIAEMGSSASSRDELHFEIRKNGKPVNPLDYLPGR
jgi:lipoprotein NlpD